MVVDTAGRKCGHLNLRGTDLIYRIGARKLEQALDNLLTGSDLQVIPYSAFRISDRLALQVISEYERTGWRVDKLYLYPQITSFEFRR